MLKLNPKERIRYNQIYDLRPSLRYAYLGSLKKYKKEEKIEKKMEKR